MNHLWRALPLLSLVVCLSSTSFAQEKQHVSFEASGSNSTYTKSMNIAVGDMPNHIVRVFEVHRTYPTNPPMIAGLRLTDEWDRGTVDLIDGNGFGTNYAVFVAEDGSEFYSRRQAMDENSFGASTATIVGIIIGGTGKFEGIQGVVNSNVTFNMEAKIDSGKTVIDYTIPK
jgi:hypothetical protein